MSRNSNEAEQIKKQNLRKYDDPLTAAMIGDEYNRPIWNSLRSTKKNAPEITTTLIQAVHQQNHNNKQDLKNELIGNGLCDPEGLEPVGLAKCLKQLEKTNSPQSLVALVVLTDANKDNTIATQMINDTITKKLNKAGIKPSPSPQPKGISALQGESQETALGG